MSTNSELLVGLSDGELEALAESVLAPPAQTRLEDLLIRNKEGLVSIEEAADLDRLLEQIDQLTVLKTRARFTLHQQRVGATQR